MLCTRNSGQSASRSKLGHVFDGKGSFVYRRVGLGLKRELHARTRSYRQERDCAAITLSKRTTALLLAGRTANSGEVAIYQSVNRLVLRDYPIVNGRVKECNLLQVASKRFKQILRVIPRAALQEISSDLFPCNEYNP